MSRSKLKRHLEQSVANRPAQQHNTVLVQQQVSALQFQGPMPPPALLEGYEKILPGAANRILEMAEREQRARHVDTRVFVVTKAVSETVGALTGFVIPGGSLFLAWMLAKAGFTGASIAAVLTALGLLGARVALAWRVSKKKEELPQQLDLPLS